MKKLFIILALAGSLSASAATEGNDTVVIKNAREVTIITNDSLQKITVRGREGESNYVYRNTIEFNGDGFARSRSVYHSPKISLSGRNDSTSMAEGTAHLAFGVNIPMNAHDGVDISPFRSWEIWFIPLQTDFYLSRARKDFISVGLGFDWRNYRMKNDTRFMLVDEEVVGLGTYPQGAKPCFSRVKTFSVNVPLLFSHKFDKDWGIGLGGVFNWNSYASIKTEFKQDGGTHKFVDKKIGQRKFTVDAMAVLYNPLFDIYLKYSPQDVLKEPSVNFHALTVGIFL